MNGIFWMMRLFFMGVIRLLWIGYWEIKKRIKEIVSYSMHSGRSGKIIVYLASLLLVTSESRAQVVPDGRTATSISTAADGHVTVNIAPVFTGVTGDTSHNSYRDFNVLAPGVTLDNSVADARTIVNEVTGANPSRIMGVLDVAGPQAHVILANPNGITINGGKFINTGGVILSTGKVSYIDRDITPITTQRNTLLTTSKGVIRVEGDGLAGVFSNLELIAKRVEVDAAITNAQDEMLARVRLAGGNSVTEVDSSISVVDITNDWTALTPGEEGGTSCADALCVDLTGRGSISSSKVEVAVTDSGAGVRLAGNMAATASDMVLAANGDITITGSLAAERNQVASTTGALHVRGHGEIKAGGTVAADAGHILLEDNALVAGGAVSFSGKKWTMQATANGAPQVIAVGGGMTAGMSGDVALNGGVVYADNAVALQGENVALSAVKQNGAWQAAAVTSSTSGVSITTPDSGSIINKGSIIQGTRRQAGGVPGAAGAVVLHSGLIENRTENAEATALVYGAEDDVVLQSAGDIKNIAGQIATNKTLYAYAGGDIVNEVEKTVIANDGLYEEYSYKDDSVFFKKTRVNGRRVTFGERLVPGAGAFITAGNAMLLQAGGGIRNIGGEIYSDGGSITLSGNAVQNDLLQAGSAYVETRCHWFCRTVGSSSLAAQGGIIRAAGNVLVSAGSLASKGGVVQSVDGNITLAVTGQVTLEALPVYTYMDVDRGLFHGNLTRLLRYDQGGSLVANRGRITVNSPYAVTLDGGEIDAAEVETPNGINTLRVPGGEAPVFPTDKLGILGGVL